MDAQVSQVECAKMQHNWPHKTNTWDGNCESGLPKIEPESQAILSHLLSSTQHILWQSAMAGCWLKGQARKTLINTLLETYRQFCKSVPGLGKGWGNDGLEHQIRNTKVFIVCVYCALPVTWQFCQGLAGPWGTQHEWGSVCSKGLVVLRVTEEIAAQARQRLRGNK